MSPLAKLSPTLAAYKELDCGLIRIGSRWIVFIEDRVFDETPYPTRLQAIDALFMKALPPSRKAVEAQQSALRG